MKIIQLCDTPATADKAEKAVNCFSFSWFQGRGRVDVVQGQLNGRIWEVYIDR